MKSPEIKSVALNQIPAKGLEIALSNDEEWVRVIFKNIFTDHTVEPKSIQGKINLMKYDADVTCTGQIKFTHHPLCAHCGNELTQNETVDFNAHFTPLYSSKEERKKRQNDAEELEVTKDDVDFCFYEKDQIDLNDILNDEIVLHMPYNYYCQDKSNCHLTIQNYTDILEKSDVDPRWTKLKNLKLNKH